jgi:NAD(P)-dependent dehydrogenase (short-subunit alcohol dehydrogenase family)
MIAYMIAKRAITLRVQAAAMSWGERGARVNSISPGIIATPLAQHELNSAIGDGYREMIAAPPSKRMAPPEGSQSLQVTCSVPMRALSPAAIC